MFAQQFDDYLFEPLNLTDEERKKVRKRLIDETLSQGLKNVVLAAITGWSTSKVSKIVAGKQNLSDEDIRTWARALGYTPDPFLVEGFDFRGYRLLEHVRNLTECIEDYLDADEEGSEYAAIVNYEMPLSIVSTLGLKASDYAVRTQVSREYDKATYLWMWNRLVSERDDAIVPEFLLYVDPHRDEFALIICLDVELIDGEPEKMREKYKAILGKDNEDTELADEFIEDNKEWLPQEVIDFEISSYINSAEVLPAEDLMTDILVQLFKEYSELAWNITGVDIVPDFIKSGNEGALSTTDIFRVFSGNAEFSDSVRQEVLSRNHYKCEVDEDHQTFISSNGNPYMEVVPLIPFFDAVPYGKAGVSAANAICLCPNCKAKLHYGMDDDRAGMLIGLYNKHKDGLKKAGIVISLSELLRIYRL